MAVAGKVISLNRGVSLARQDESPAKQWLRRKDDWLRHEILEHDAIDLLATEILGYVVKPFHLETLQFQFEHPDSLQLAYRGAGKSTLCTITKAIHYLLKNPNLRILLASETVGGAEKFLREIKGHFESNERLLEVFGPYYDAQKTDKWDTREINVLPRTKHTKESNIACVGADSSVALRHVDVILSDDLAVEKNSRTKGRRDKLKTWYYQSLDPCLEPPDPDVPHRGEHHRLGTRYHWDDLYGHLIANELKHHHRIYRGLLDGKSPWPEKHSPEWFKKKRKQYGAIIFGAQMLCHSDDTEFLTESGWFLWGEIADDRALATYNVKTAELEYQRSEDRICEPYEGTLLRVKSLKVNALVTPDHQMLCKPADYPSKDSWAFIDARNVALKRSGRTGRVLFPSQLIWRGKEIGSFQIKQGWRKDRHKVGIWNEYSRKKHGPMKVSMDVFLRFLGFFASEGSTNKKSRGYISLSQNEGGVLAEMRTALREMGFVHREYKSNNTVTLAFRHIGLWEWLRTHVKTCSADACIPRQFFALSGRQLRILFDALMAGDGYRECNKKSVAFQYSSVSKQLADDVAELGLLVGYDSSTACMPARKIYRGGREYMQRSDCWRVCLRRANGNGIDPIKQIKEVPYSGNVVCFKVPNGTLITRRKGKILISGNCDTELMKGEIFQYDDCQQIDADEVPSGLKVFTGTDLAVGKKVNDQFAQVAIGLDDKTGFIYVLEAYAAHLRFSQQKERWKEMYGRRDPIRAGIESNAYQDVLRQDLKDEDKDFRAIPIHTSEDKVTRAQKLSAKFEDKRMFFVRGSHMAEMIDQLVLFPGYRFDDLFDALDIADRTSRKRKRRASRENEPGLNW